MTILEAEFDLVHAAEEAAKQALEQDRPDQLRQLAEALNSVSLRLSRKLSSLQGQLNGKAFGRS